MHGGVGYLFAYLSCDAGKVGLSGVMRGVVFPSFHAFCRLNFLDFHVLENYHGYLRQGSLNLFPVCRFSPWISLKTFLKNEAVTQ